MRAQKERPRQAEPNGSEVVVGDWLKEYGCDAVEYVGDSEGPPDFLARYDGNQIAVEATRLLDGEGWDETKRVAFELELKREIENTYSDYPEAQRWHARCSYDPIEPRPPSKQGTWRKKVRRAILGEFSAGPVQLLVESEIRGRGVRLRLTEASNAGSFTGVSSDEGSWVLGPLTTRVGQTIATKSNRVRAGKRASDFETWWLVLDDEVLYAPEVLTKSERAQVTECVRGHPDRNHWSKIVLVSKYQTRAAPPQETLPLRFWVLWEERQQASDPLL